jgi:hypothetical protein
MWKIMGLNITDHTILPTSVDEGLNVNDITINSNSHEHPSCELTYSRRWKQGSSEDFFVSKILGFWAKISEATDVSHSFVQVTMLKFQD